MGSWLTMGSDPMARAWHALFSDRLVQRTLAFIRAHYAKPIRPQDVVKELKVSRRFRHQPLASAHFHKLARLWKTHTYAVPGFSL